MMQAITLGGIPVYYIISALIFALLVFAAIYKYSRAKKNYQTLQMESIEEDPFMVDFKAAVEQVRGISNNSFYTDLVKKLKTVHTFTQDEYTKLIEFCVTAFKDAAEATEEKRSQLLEKVSVLVQPIVGILKDSSATLESLNLARTYTQSIKTVSESSTQKWCAQVKSTLGEDISKFSEGRAPEYFGQHTLNRREFMSGKSHLRLYAENITSATDEEAKRKIIDCLKEIKEKLYNDDNDVFTQSLNGCWEARDWGINLAEEVQEQLGLR